MEFGYDIIRKLENGEELHVAWRPSRHSAERLVQDLMESWPAEYDIHELSRSRFFCVPYVHGHGWTN